MTSSKSPHAGFERRKSERVDLPIFFSYCIPGAHCERAFAVNVSNGGMSFFIPKPLEREQSIEIGSQFHKEMKKGRVKWLRHIVASTWRVGIEFE